MDPEILYHQLGRLIETMPDFYLGGAWTSDKHKWVGQADALIMQSGDISDKTDWRTALERFDVQPHSSASTMIRVLYRVLAAAELKAPASAKGTFIPVGNSFDAFVALAKVLQTATRDVLKCHYFSRGAAHITCPQWYNKNG
jgi:hypothetical protein